MDQNRTTLLVAVAGIAATALVGLAGTTAAWLSARSDRAAQRDISREERTHDRRVAAYLDAVDFLKSQERSWEIYAEQVPFVDWRDRRDVPYSTFRPQARNEAQCFWLTEGLCRVSDSGDREPRTPRCVVFWKRLQVLIARSLQEPEDHRAGSEGEGSRHQGDGSVRRGDLAFRGDRARGNRLARPAWVDLADKRGSLPSLPRAHDADPYKGAHADSVLACFGLELLLLLGRDADV